MGPIIVIALRLLLPLFIFRYRITGALISMAADALDVVTITFLNAGEFSSYHTTDKYLDMYYLSIEGYVSLSWKNTLAKKTSIVLFVWRVVGFVLFEFTHMRTLLFFFPNLFENFFLFYIFNKKFAKKDLVSSKKSLFIILAILLVPKLAQEYFLHVMETQPWKWIRFNILGMDR